MQMFILHPKKSLIVLRLNHTTSRLSMLLHHIYACPPFLFRIILIHDIKFYIPMNFSHCSNKWILNVLYLMILCLEKKQNSNEPLHLFITKGVGKDKIFMLMLLIQGLLHFYNKHLESNLFKKIILLMAYTGKHLTLMEPQFIQVFFIPFNCKKIPSLSSNLLNNMIKKYDQL